MGERGEGTGWGEGTGSIGHGMRKLGGCEERACLVCCGVENRDMGCR